MQNRLRPGLGSGHQDELDLLAHDGSRRAIPLGRQGLTVGRAPGNDLVLDHPSVSRQHARIDFDGTNYNILDLGSTNGTYLGDIRLLPAVPQIWTPDRTLKIGDNRLRLRRFVGPAPTVGQPGAVSRMAPSMMPGSLAQAGTERPRVGLFADVKDLSVEAGGSTTAMVSVLNQGSLVDHFQLTVSGIPASWVHIPSEAIRLLPGVSQDIPIVLMPPRSPQSRAGRYGITIQARSRDNPDQLAEVVASVCVEAFHHLDLEIRPQRRTAMTSGRFQLSLTNLGNAELAVGFVATDPEEIGQYTFQPSNAVVPPGQVQTIHLEVRSRISTLPQTARSVPFTVSARAVEAPDLAAQVHGEWVQSSPVFELELRPHTQRGTQQGVFALRVTNSSDGSLTVQFSATDSEETGEYSFSPAQIIAPPGQESDAQLQVRARAPLPNSEARSLAFTVTARAVEAPLITRQAQGEWVQVPPDFQVTVHPLESAGVVEGTFTVQLSNRSDAGLTLQLSATDPEGACQCLFDRPEVVVSAGQSSRVQLVVRPGTPQPQGTPTTHLVTITARPVQAPGIYCQAQAQWTQMPPVPSTPAIPQSRRAARAARPKETPHVEHQLSPPAARRRIPTWLWILIGLIVVAVVVGYLLMGGSGGPRLTPDKPEEPAVEPAEPEEQGPPTRTPGPATRLEAPLAVELLGIERALASSPVTGRVGSRVSVVESPLVPPAWPASLPEEHA